MTSLVRFLSVALAASIATAATAQSTAAPQQVPQSAVAYGPAPVAYRSASLSQADSQALNAALSAVHSNDLSRAETYRAQITDPAAQMVVKWAEVDVFGSRMSFLELDGARRDLAGWPRDKSRQMAAERAMTQSAMDPDRTIVWFDGAPPATADGAMALATALQAKGRTPEAQALIKSWWRDHLFDADVQARMYTRFGSWLDVSDHQRRLDILLLGPQGPAVQGLLPLLPAESRALADAAMSARRGGGGGGLSSPVVNFERARYLRAHGGEAAGLSYARNFPAAPLDDEIADKMWLERRNYFNAALRNHDWSTAYAVMNNTGFISGEKMVESEFFAGWIALTKLHDPANADQHFAALQRTSSTPITQGRAAYWRGRAAEARGDAAAAQASYGLGAKYITSFYGQLAAEKAGVKMITLPKDPIPTDADRQRFEARSTVRAARMLSAAGDRDLFRLFVMSTAETLPNAEETALLVDLARYSGDQDLSMRVVRIGAQRGFILAERGYPILSVPQSPGSAEPAFALSIARQESNFWPQARSNANARGIMQLEPATARHDAAQLGVPWNEGALYQTEYNMRLGAYELGKLVNLYGGSYIMAAGGYNAGPGRPTTWTQLCGDPRGGTSDPLDFVECIPFTETRNYVMRTFETTEIYRARLAGGSAPLTAIEDLKRGAYGYTPAPAGSPYVSVTGSAGGPATGVAAQPPASAPGTTAAVAPPVTNAPVGYVPDPSIYTQPITVHDAPKKAEPEPKARHSEEVVIDCTAALSRHGRHRDRFAERNCPREVSTHSASKRKHEDRRAGEKASRGGAKAAKHPSSKTSAKSANRSHKRRS